MSDRPFRTFEGLPPEVKALIEAAVVWREECLDSQLFDAVEALREPPVKRYTVELRPPVDGEQYLTANAQPVTAYGWRRDRVEWVIVGEVDK